MSDAAASPLPAHEQPDPACRFGITPAQIQDCLRIRAEGAGGAACTLTEAAVAPLEALRGRPLAEILVARGYLAPERRAEFEREMNAAAVNRPPAPADGTVEPMDVSPAPPSDESPATPEPFPGALPPGAEGPRRHFGRYELVAELGHGGMGVVYKAFLPDLKKYFALKVLLAGRDASDKELERFHREAEAAARLEHPGIVGVVDIGKEEGRTYFAMEYVEGTTLDRVLEDPLKAGIALAPGGSPYQRPTSAEGAPTRPRTFGLNATVAVQMTQEIAEALQAAHDAGVVHRDLKPSNVIRDRSGRLKVMDFGLAKLVDAADKTGATRTGAVMGTPAYMSPEQAEGRVREVDAVSDVYQIGAILYELLTGRPPYDGTSAMEILLQVMQDDPVPPRRLNPRIGRDAETVCLKCLERDKRRRYPSAAALAAELGRILAGDPIEARPISALARLARKTSKHRRVVIPIAAALLLAAGATIWGWQRQSAALAGRRDMLGKLRATVLDFEDTVMSIEMPAEARTRLARQPLEMLQTLIDHDPAYGPLYSWRGEVERVMGRTTEAAADFDRGCKLSPESSVAWYLRGKYRLFRYAEARGVPSSVMCGGTVEIHLAPETAEQRQWCSDGMADLGRMRQAALKDPLIGQEDERLARALAALYRGDRQGYEEALQALAGNEGPKALKLRGEALYLAMRFAEAEQAFSRALVRWACDPDLWKDRGGAREVVALTAQASGQDPREGYRKAIADFAELLRRRPDFPWGYVSRGFAYVHLGEAEAVRGQDPRESFCKAIADCTEGLRRGAGGAVAYSNRGIAYESLGEAQAARGEDPRETYGKAIADYAEALRREPGYALASMNRGLAYVRLGEALVTHGEDPRPTYQAAIADYNGAVGRDPALANAYCGRAAAFLRLGEAEERQGIDPCASFGKAIADCGEALRRNAAFNLAYISRGSAYANLGDTKSARGEDPREAYLAAIADYGEAVRRNPQYAAAYSNRASVFLRLGQAENGRGTDPRVSYRKAIADGDAALRCNPEDTRAYNNRGAAYLVLGRAEAERSADPRESYRKAIADLGEALRRNREYAQAYANRGNAHLWLAETLARSGQDATESILQAETDYRQAIARHHFAAYRNLGVLYRETSRWDEAVAAFEAYARTLPGEAAAAREMIDETRRKQAAAQGPAWVRQLAAGDSAISAGDYPAARKAYEEGLAALAAAGDPRSASGASATPTGPTLTPSLRAALAAAHYNLACVYALASAGHDGPQAAVKPVAPEAATPLRTSAFEHLEQAIQLGWSDRAHLEQDTDLAPLHDDPRWVALLARLK